MKAGSLDNYLLNTKPKYIDSKFGLYLRDLLKQKLQDPENFRLKYIPGTATTKRNKKTKAWEHKNIPAMYIPAHVKATTDLSEFYEKSPHEMSRYELQELEKIMMLRENDQEPEGRESETNIEMFDENGEPLTKLEILKKGKTFKANKDEFRKI